MITKKTIGLVVFSVAVLIVFGVAGLNDNSSQENNAGSSPTSTESFHSKQRTIKIAACPTYFDKIKGVDPEKYEIIKTGSTAQSIAAVRTGHAEMIIAGRTLKPNEPRMDYSVIGEGYSFLSADGGVVYKDELKDRSIYTDLKPDILKDAFSLQNIEHVDDVYTYLDRGIVITSWKNTDYTKAEIVHLLERDGKRAKLSRRATIYYPDNYAEKAKNVARLLKRTNI